MKKKSLTKTFLKRREKRLRAGSKRPFGNKKKKKNFNSKGTAEIDKMWGLGSPKDFKWFLRRKSKVSRIGRKGKLKKKRGFLI